MTERGPRKDQSMRAMVLTAPGTPLTLRQLPVPEPGAGQVLVRVSVCGVCRTDLHVVDGDLGEPRLPLVPGHQIIGRIERCGPGVDTLSTGQRIGIPWLGGSCGHCAFCEHGNENLCDLAVYTGYQINGGFAEYCVADARFCFPIAEMYPDLQAAPLLCAGLIGYRALAKAGDAEHIGLYGFGAAAHILVQVARYQGRHTYAFTRPDDIQAQQFALDLGASWAGASGEPPPRLLDAAIIFAPVGALVPEALTALRKGGRVVCAGIHMSEIPSFAYASLWGERSICSVANLTRRDGREFLRLAPKIPVKTEVHRYPLEAANQALDDLRHGRFTGAAVVDVAG